MDETTALQIRSRTFVGGIIIGAIVGFVLVEHSLRGLIVSGIAGGNFLGEVGEAYISGATDDIAGAGFTLGFIAGILIALTTPFGITSFVVPFLSGAIGVALGYAGFALGRATKMILP